MTSRENTLASLKANPRITVLIVGAGINGIGTFRDLALQGIDALIVDAADFGSGASAASSHMVHGGIRYLENGEFRLVREAVAERNRLLANAPHAVKPLPTTIPIFRLASGMLNAPLKFLRLLSRPSERGALLIKIGLILYDAYTGHPRRVPEHTFRGRDESRKLFPALSPQVRWTATYYDGFMPSPERICMELIFDAEASHPQARALSYVRAVEASGEVVTLRDEITGSTFDVQPQIVINASGAWIDFTNAALGTPTKFIGGTKGSHLIIDHPELRAAIGEHEFLFENADGRIVLIMPFFDKVMVGSSDIHVESPDGLCCTAPEVDYYCGMVTRVFPGITISPSQIVFTFTGVRPLPASDAKFAGQISRDHSIRVTEPGGDRTFPVLSLVGGKWTSFRAFSEQTTDAVLARLGKSRKVSTGDLPIGGGRDYPLNAEQQAGWIDGVASATGLPPEQVSSLFERYGTRAAEFAGYIAEAPDRPLNSAPEYSRREIEYLAQCEKVIHLDDLGLRRMTLGMLGGLSCPVIEELAEIAGGALGWSAEQRQAEIDRTVEVLAMRHGVRAE